MKIWFLTDEVTDESLWFAHSPSCFHVLCCGCLSYYLCGSYSQRASTRTMATMSQALLAHCQTLSKDIFVFTCPPSALFCSLLARIGYSHSNIFAV